MFLRIFLRLGSSHRPASVNVNTKLFMVKLVKQIKIDTAVNLTNYDENNAMRI